MYQKTVMHLPVIMAGEFVKTPIEVIEGSMNLLPPLDTCLGFVLVFMLVFMLIKIV